MRSLGLSKKGFAQLIIALCSMLGSHLYFCMMLLYVPFQNCFGLTNTQIAVLLSIYSVTSIPFSVFFGWLSDAVSPKFCMYMPCLMSGLLGIILCFDPGYTALKLIFALMPIGGMAWSSLIKCMKNLARDNSYIGKIFGSANTFDGLLSSAIYLFFIFYFGNSIGEPANFRIIIWTCNIMSIMAGLLVLFFLDYDWIVANSSNYTVTEKTSFVRGLITAVKVPEVWAVGVLSIVYYAITCVVNYTTPYLINGFGIPIAYTTLFSVISRYTLKTFAGNSGGRLRDRKGAMYKALKPMSVVTSVTLLLMAVLPMKSSLVIPACVLGAALIYFYIMMSTAGSVTLTEYNPPANLHGMMNAVVTIVGSLGTVFMSNICGRILDAWPLAGYRYCFLLGIAVEAIFFFSGDMLRLCSKLPNSMYKNRADHAFDR